MKPRPRVVEIVAVEVVDHRGERAGADERVHDLVVEEDIHRGHGLVGVVLADHAFAGLRVVGLADARQQQQAHVVQHVGRQDHHLGRLEELFAGAVDVGHAGGALAVGRQLDPQHLAFGLQREVRTCASGRAGSWSAGWPWSSCRSRTSRRTRSRCRRPAARPADWCRPATCCRSGAGTGWRPSSAAALPNRVGP